jgi:hypothetical protein
MPFIVTLDVYSGRANPSWKVDDDVIAKIAHAKNGTGPLPVLGYRGFHVWRARPEHAAARVEGAQESGGAYVAGNWEAEELLLSTAGGHVDDELRAHVRESIRRGPDTAALHLAEPGAPTGCPPCRAADAPVYNPGFWNTPARQPNNNCYNYANDQATNTYAQPGRATGHPINPPPTCANVRSAATSDGLRACANFNGTLHAGQGWYVALVIWPGRDYHWYRQDKVGCWSHKIGWAPAHDWDNVGKPIIDPQHCDRGSYRDFCIYMITTSKVHIS